MRSSSSVSPADLSRDPLYRGLVAASRQDPATLGILNDYRQERGLPPLARGLARQERKISGPTCPEDIQRADRLVAAMARRNAEIEREKAFAVKHRDIALAVGAAYHGRVRSLYTSKRGEVVYGSGGQEDLDWDAYGKKGYRNPHTGRKQPAKWRNAGARIEGRGKKACIVLENHRGTEVARLPLPPRGVNLNTWITEVA